MTPGPAAPPPPPPLEGMALHWGQTLWVALVCTTGREPDDPGYARQPLLVNDRDCEPYGDRALTNRVTLSFGPFTGEHEVAYCALMASEQGPTGFRAGYVNYVRRFMPRDTAVFLRGSLLIPLDPLDALKRPEP